MPRITIEQLDENGEAWRTFEQYPLPHEVEGRLHRITYAYNLNHTRVTVDGREVRLYREVAAMRER